MLLSYCEPCPPGTFAAQAGSEECAQCSATQLCPIATSDPIDVSAFRALISQSIAEAIASTGAGSTAGSGSAGGRRRLRAAYIFERIAREDTDMKFLTDAVEYGTTRANITRAEIRTEEVAEQRLYLVFAVLVVCVGIALLIVGFCLFSYMKSKLKKLTHNRPQAPPITKAARQLTRQERLQRRLARFLKLDRLYTDQIQAKREEVMNRGEAQPQPAKAAAEEAEEGGEEAKQTKLGAAFTLVGIGLAVIAAGYVLLQFSIANFQIVQTLQPGASPSAADIVGEFNVTAAFVGFGGPCQIVQQSAAAVPNSNGTRFAGREGVAVSITGIGPAEGAPAPAAEASHSASRRTCLVSWRCVRCRLLAASNASVDFRLVSRLAFAVAVNFAVHVPSYLSIEGVVVPSSEAAFSAFRGTLPVTDVRDGEPRYDAALRAADNRVAERGEGSFGLCSFTKPLSDAECAGESVNFRVRFDVDNVYVMVYRKVKASIADMLADLSSLTQTAIAVGGQIAIAAVTAHAFMRRRREGSAGPPSEASIAIGANAGLGGERPSAAATKGATSTPTSIGSESGDCKPAIARGGRRRSNSFEFGDYKARAGGPGADGGRFVHLYDIGPTPAPAPGASSSARALSSSEAARKNARRGSAHLEAAGGSAAATRSLSPPPRRPPISVATSRYAYSYGLGSNLPSNMAGPTDRPVFLHTSTASSSGQDDSASSVAPNDQSTMFIKL
eukprot:tig00000737_g3800.t1